MLCKREYQQAVKSEDFENDDNYDTSVVAWDVFSKLHKFQIHPQSLRRYWLDRMDKRQRR